MTKPQTQASDIVLGAGYAYFDPEDAGGVNEGAFYIPQTSALALSANAEKFELEDADEPVAETIVSITNKVTRSGTLTTRDQSAQNLQLFLMGASSTVTQVATPVVDEPINNVQQGRYYLVGASLSNPGGVRNPTLDALTDDGLVAKTGAVLQDDGYLYITPGGDIADGTNLLLDYTPEANTRNRIITNADGAKRGALRYVENNTKGENRIWFFPLVELSGNGDLALKDRGTARELPFSINVLTKTGYEQAYVDGVPVV